MYINWYLSLIQTFHYIYGRRYIYTWRNSPGSFALPLPTPHLSPFRVPLYLLGTLLAVTGIVHLSLRLLVNLPHFPHTSPISPPPPLQIPRTPTAQRLTKTTSGIFRLLLSGTGGIEKHMIKS